MPIIRAEQAPHFDLDGFHFLGFTSPSRGATELCTWQLAVEPGAISETHRINREEVFLPLEGSLSIIVDGEEIKVLPGDAYVVPAHSLFQVANLSNEAVRALVCLSAGFTATSADGREIGTPPWAR